MKFLSVGWGARLHLIDGAKASNINLTFVPLSTENDPISSWRASFNPTPSENWLDSIYGGDASIQPGSMSNHRPGAWYHDKFYFSVFDINDNAHIYILSWDGSGIYKHRGFAAGVGYSAAWRNGRGTEMLSPSGAHMIDMQACAHIVHNGILFILGSSPSFTTNDGGNPWRTKEGWDVLPVSNTGDSSNRRKRRRYIAFGIDKRRKQGGVGAKDHKFIRTPTEFLPIATTQEDTHACDAISYGNDIIFASYCDLVRFPGGSGQAKLIESTLGKPSSKCFDFFPTSGFNLDGEPIFGQDLTKPDLLVLTGSGVLKKINFYNTGPSGTKTIFDLADITNDPDNNQNNRTGGPLTRVTSTTAEPTRSCYLKMFNKQLHAFFPSATSGYHYMKCDGDPSISTNWTNKTQELPEDIRRWDGDIYGHLDVFRNSLYLMHVSKSEYGLWGFVGGQKGAGGMHITQLDPSFAFNNIYRGVSAEPPIGLLPYNNVGVNAVSPSGNGPFVIASTDYALVNYRLYSAYPTICKVNIEYSIDNGMTWHSARRFRSYITGLGLGEATIGLAASYFGVAHTFYWDHVNDIGMNGNKRTRIRVTPEIER